MGNPRVTLVEVDPAMVDRLVGEVRRRDGQKGLLAVQQTQEETVAQRRLHPVLGVVAPRVVLVEGRLFLVPGRQGVQN